MIRGFAAAAGTVLIFLATASCRTAPDADTLLRLEPGANPAGEAVTLKGRLVRSGACLAVEGNGNTIVVWPRTAQARADGSGNVIVVWPFRRTDPPLRTGEEVELTGIIMADDIAGFARLPDDPGCRGSRYLVVRETQATPTIVPVPHLRAGADPGGAATTLKGTLVRSGACLAVEGSGITIIVWPRTAQARADGNGNVIVVWPFRRTDPPLRTGEEVELTGIIMADDIAGFARLPDDSGCRTGRYLVVREARPR